jgi:hypothetical protein
MSIENVAKWSGPGGPNAGRLHGTDQRDEHHADAADAQSHALRIVVH